MKASSSSWAAWPDIYIRNRRKLHRWWFRYSRCSRCRYEDIGSWINIQINISFFFVCSIQSHSVQRAVSACLEHLMVLVPEARHQAFIDQLLILLAEGKTYGERKGASLGTNKNLEKYHIVFNLWLNCFCVVWSGLAGIVKGLKISALKKYNIMTALATLVQDKNDASKRQGALFAVCLITIHIKPITRYIIGAYYETMFFNYIQRILYPLH